MFKKYCTLIISISMMFVLFAASLVYGNTLEEVNQKKGEVKSEMTKLNESLEEQQKEIEKVQAEVDKKQEEINKTENEAKQCQIRIDNIKDSMATQKNNLGGRLRTMYKNGSVGFVDVILRSADLSEFLSNVSMVQRIYASDQKLLNKLEKDYEEMKRQEKLLEELKESLIASKKQIDDKKAELEKKKSEMKADLDKLQSQYDALEADSQAIAEMLRQQAQPTPPPAEDGSTEEAPVYNGGGGSLSWPCSGPITSPFGYRMHPIFHTWMGHTGIDIGVPTGTPIHAAADGVVVLSSWYGGYGNAVIINHGDGIATLYGHNSSLAVSEGEHVSRGQVIAYAGSTGNSTGPHCHFEVRLNGNPVNPIGYL